MNLESASPSKHPHANSSALQFITADSKFGEKKIEINLAKSTIEGEEVIIALFQDISDREKLAELNAQNQFKENILASFSHELKTPINSGMLLVHQALENLDSKEEVRPLLLKCLNSHRRLDLLVDDLLDLHLISNSRFNLNHDEINLEEFIRSMQLLYENQAQEKNLQFEVKIANDTPEIIFTDARRLSQVINGLLSNAFKYTFEGKVTLSVKNDLAKQRFIKFSVKDTGIGIPKFNQELLREILKQEDLGKKITSFSTGAGLGLCTSNAIAKKLGKGISLECSEGEGSKFWFSVKNHNNLLRQRPKTISFERRVEENVFADENEQGLALNNFDKLVKSNYTLIRSKTSLQHIPYPRCNHPQIIITDDDAFNVISLRGIFNKMGYRTLEFFNGLNLVEGLKKLWLDECRQCMGCKGLKLIFLDCNMPVMDGYEAVQQLKLCMEREELPKIPVVACTAYTHQSEKLKCMEAGFDDFISKPLQLDKLREVVKKYMDPPENRAKLSF